MKTTGTNSILTNMKTCLIFLCFISFCCINSINAQWYVNKYGVEKLSDLSNDQLIESYSNAKTQSIVGGVLTGTGIGLMFAGVLKGAVNTTEEIFIQIFSFGLASTSHESYGGGLMISGALLAIGGTITWISGGSRKKQMKPILESMGLVSNISIYPGAGYDLMTDTFYPAVTIKMGL